jgi:hypothetical protein
VEKWDCTSSSDQLVLDEGNKTPQIGNVVFSSKVIENIKDLPMFPKVTRLACINNEPWRNILSNESLYGKGKCMKELRRSPNLIFRKYRDLREH